MKNSRLKRVFNTIINFILPPLCPICNKRVDVPHMLCATCFKRLNFITKPYCQKCGRPFEFDIKGESLCAACMKDQPRYNKARSNLVYDEGAKELILPFKHADRTDLAHILSEFLIREQGVLIDEAEIIIPVPLYITRLFKRRYNQSALLAKRICKIKHKQYEPRVLRRIKPTVSQGHMNKIERAANVKGAFAVFQPDIIRDKKVLLIDDVMTTGATVNECTKVLMKSGASQVDILTVARVKH